MRWLQKRDERRRTLFSEKEEIKSQSLYKVLEQWRQNDVLRDPNKTSKYFYGRIWIAIGLFFAGILLAFLMGNWLLAFPLALGFFSAPFIQAAIEAEKADYKKIEQEEMSLSVLCGQYLSEESFEKAVVSAMPYMEGIVKEEMTWFLNQSRFINADTNELMEHLIREAKARNDDLLAEWYLELKKSFRDKELKKELLERAELIGEQRIAKREFQISMDPLTKEFFIMAAMVPISRWIMLFLNRDWFEVLRNTVFGQIVTLLAFCILLATTHRFFHLKIHDDAIRLEKSKKKGITDRELFRFTKYLRYELQRSRNLPEILNAYVLVADEPLKTQLQRTVAEMKIGNTETALLMLDRRVENQMMTDICRGLGAFLQGEIKESYWQVIERKLLEEARAKRKEINNRRKNKIHSLGLWLLTGVMCLFLSVMLIQIVMELGQIFG